MMGLGAYAVLALLAVPFVGAELAARAQSPEAGRASVVRTSLLTFVLACTLSARFFLPAGVVAEGERPLQIGEDGVGVDRAVDAGALEKEARAVLPDAGAAAVGVEVAFVRQKAEGVPVGLPCTGIVDRMAGDAIVRSPDRFCRVVRSPEQGSEPAISIEEGMNRLARSLQCSAWVAS